MEGPLQGVDRIGRCDYKIFVKGKVKHFHANLLKKYVSRDEAGVVQIAGVARSIFEICEMAFAGIIDGSIDEGAEVGESSSVNDENLIELPDFRGKESIEDVKNQSLFISDTEKGDKRNLE